MSIKKRPRNLTAAYWAMFFLLVFGINYFVLSNEIVRNGIIEFLLPVLEGFLHQPEMDISAIGMGVHT